MWNFLGIPRFTGKTRITGKTAEIPEIPKNKRKLNMIYTKFMLSNVFTCLREKHFVSLLPIQVYHFKYLTLSSNLVYSKK